MSRDRTVPPIDLLDRSFETGIPADYSGTGGPEDSVNGAEWGSTRTLEAGDLESLLLGVRVGVSPPRGLHVIGARINGILNLENALIKLDRSLRKLLLH
jgi:hypothetical protein